MKVSQENPRGDDKLQILDVCIALWNGGVIVEHQQNAGGHLNRKRAQSQRAQIPGDAETQLLLVHACGEDLFELFPPATQCVKGILYHTMRFGFQARLHDQTRTYSRAAVTLTERSTIKLPSSLIQVLSQGRARGAGPARTLPSRSNWLP